VCACYKSPGSNTDEVYSGTTPTPTPTTTTTTTTFSVMLTSIASIHIRILYH